MILMAPFLSFSLWRSTSGIRIFCMLLADGLLVYYMWPSATIARNLLLSASHLTSLSLNWTSFSLDLVKALLTKLLVSILDSLNYWVFIGYHSLSEHWRRGISMIGILSIQDLLVLFSIYLSLILSLLDSIDEMTSVGSLVHSKSSRRPSNCYTSAWSTCT